jgi:hypothetical protein
VLIVFLALWLVAISLVLRFVSIASGLRCAACGGELELLPDSRHCPDCGKDVAIPRRVGDRRGALHEDEREAAVHALVESVLYSPLMRSQRGERAHPTSPPGHYQRASSGSTRSAKSRTLP